MKTPTAVPPRSDIDKFKTYVAAHGDVEVEYNYERSPNKDLHNSKDSHTITKHIKAKATIHSIASH